MSGFFAALGILGVFAVALKNLTMQNVVPARAAGAGSWLGSGRETQLAIFVISGLLYFWRRAPFLGQWDSFDYLKEVVTHQLSPLGLGRPVFVGYNIALWETLKRIFRLEPQQVESVALGGVIIAGALGVWIFSRLVRQVLPPAAARMALLALILSPTYAFYAGCVMTEVPMFAAAVAAGAVLWVTNSRRQMLMDVAAGLLWGVAVGIREQALVLFPAYLWILWIRRSGLRARTRTVAAFMLSSLPVILLPALILYLQDPSMVAGRMKTWLNTIPTGRSHFWMNVQASLLWTFAACPAAWLAVAGAWLWHLKAKRTSGQKASGPFSGPAAVAGILCCLVLPMAVLWRDADVQIHPRYAIVALPAALILCAGLFRHWAPSRRAAVVWAVLQILIFGLTQVAMQPFRAVQFEKRDYARLVRETVRGPALLIAGGNSAAFDYYRCIGLQPGWRIAWSGWDWSPGKLGAAMQDCWDRGEPVYVCDGPSTWLNLEGERLDLEFLLQRLGLELEPVAPGLKRVLPKGKSTPQRRWS